MGGTAVVSLPYTRTQEGRRQRLSKGDSGREGSSSEGGGSEGGGAGDGL